MQIRRHGIIFKQSTCRFPWTTKLMLSKRPQLLHENLMDHQAKNTAVRLGLCILCRGGGSPFHKVKDWPARMEEIGVSPWVLVQQIIFTGIVGSKGTQTPHL